MHITLVLLSLCKVEKRKTSKEKGTMMLSEQVPVTHGIYHTMCKTAVCTLVNGVITHQNSKYQKRRYCSV